MANGYIGKISALVTASTADLSRKLQGGTRDVNRFANSVQSQIAGAASSARRSFEGIFTPLQRIQRALEAGRGSLNIIDDAQVRRFQQAVSIAEQINKPLAAASRAFQGLSADVAAGLLPALLRAQDAATRVNDEIGTTGGVTASSYRVAEQAIDRAAAAFERFRQAEQIIASAPRGQELQFNDPQLFSALQRSAEARRGAAAPGVASRVGGALGDAVREVTRFDELVAQAAARISGIRLAPQVDTSQLERAQGEYQELLIQQRRAVEELNRLSTAPPPDPGRGFVLRQRPEEARGLGLFGRQAGSDADAAIQRAQRLSAVFDALPESARAAVGGLAGIAARVADEVATAGTGVAQLNAVLDILEGRLSTSSAAAAAQAQRVRQSGEAAREAAAKLTSLATAIQAALGNARPTVDSLEQDFRRLLEVVQKSPAGRTAFKPILDELLELFTAARNGADNLDQIIAKLNELRSAGARGASGGLTILSGADVQADKAKQAARTIQEARDALSQRLLGGFGGAGQAGLNLGIDEQELRGFGGQIEFLQNKLSQFSADVRGPAVAALQRYREVVNEVFQSGAQNTDAGRKAIATARAEVVRLVATLDGVKPERLASALKRVGDVARGAGSNAGLAIQQAAFAVEDFFSVTGGLDQRIRAAGNNISQLGFIVGSTTGLIVGISAAIGSQLVAALIRWSNAGTEAQDRTKALNEALARQKSLVEDLAQAFDSLGDRLLSGVFSPAAEEAREVANQLDEIRRKQRELRDAGIVDLDPEVQRQRAIQGARQRQLEGEDNIGRRIALQNQIAAARRAEQEAAAAAVGRAAPTARDVEAGLRRTVFVDGARGLSPANRRDLEQIRQDVAGAAGDPRQLIQLLQRARTEQERLALQNAGNQVRAPRARENVEALTRLINALERELGTGIDAAANRLVQSIDAPARRLRDAQDRLREAVEAGVPGAAAVVNSVNEIGAGFDAARQTLVDRLEQGLPLDQATVDAATRQRDAALANVEATLRESAAIDIARQALDRFAQALDQASQEAQSNLQSAQQAADEARRADLGRSTPATRQAREQADADLARQRELASGVEQEVAAARERVAADVARQAAIPADIDRRRQEAQRQAAEQSAPLRSQAAAAERQLQGAAGFRQAISSLVEAEFSRFGRRATSEEIAADPGLRGLREAANRAQAAAEAAGINTRKELDPQIQQAQQAAAAAAGQLAAITGDLEGTLAGLDAELIAASEGIVASFRRIAEIDELLQTQGVLGEGQREELVRERAQLEQQAVEMDEQVRRARDESTREAEQAAAAARGRELSLTDGERAAADLTRGLEDIRQFFGRQAEETTGLVDFEAQAAAQQRFIDQSLRSAAPAIFGLADQVANAVLQGPSRAALQATDVSTVEGSRELNRLLRGDDQARDQNLVELQKQSTILEDMLEELRKGGADVAN
jgi:colicin import membrane protein